VLSLIAVCAAPEPRYRKSGHLPIIGTSAHRAAVVFSRWAACGAVDRSEDGTGLPDVHGVLAAASRAGTRRVPPPFLDLQL
jgi:hypothetical protein